MNMMFRWRALDPLEMLRSCSKLERAGSSGADPRANGILQQFWLQIGISNPTPELSSRPLVLGATKNW